MILAGTGPVDPAAAQRMESAVDILRYEGRGFVMTLTTSTGRPLEADGRAVAGRAVLRLRDVSGIESELMDLAARHDGLMGDLEIMKTLLNSLPTPVWARDHDGRLILVNEAFVAFAGRAFAGRAQERPPAPAGLRSRQPDLQIVPADRHASNGARGVPGG